MSLRGRLRRWLHGTLPVWYHPSMRVPLAGAQQRLGVQPRRADDVLTWLIDRDILPRSAVRYPAEVRWSDVAAVHEASYLARLDQPEEIARIIGVDLHVVPAEALVELWRRATRGVIEAVQHVRQEGGHAAVLSGGFHHAAPTRGAGFCGINDVAVAIAHARQGGLHGRVVVLDLDAHPPDGTLECLAEDAHSAVLSLSVASEWRGPEEVACERLDARIPAGAGDEAYLEALDGVLEAVGEPELCLVLAGADPLRGDPLGGLDCTEEGLWERDRRVVRCLRGVPTVWLPAGGYTEGAWRVFAGAIARAAGHRGRVRAGYDPVWRRSRAVAATLDPEQLGQTEWLTEEDLGLMGPSRGPSRFLGTYSRHGIEYALTRYGLLPALRRMGFSGLEVELRAGSYPHALRVSADAGGEREVLVDLRLSIKELAGLRVLFVEWLELRDPRRAPGDRRPALPGQSAPGLGLAREVTTLIAMAARRVGLDGVGLVPAHFHIAWIARRRFRFVDPVQQGRFEALCARRGERPLAQYSARLDDPGLPTPAGPITWEPMPMLLPRTESARALLSDREEAVEAAREELAARLGAGGTSPDRAE